MEEVAYEFEKGKDEMIKARLCEFAGQRRADLRVYFQDGKGDWHPTKRGIAVAAEHVGQLKKAISKLEAALQKN